MQDKLITEKHLDKMRLLSWTTLPATTRLWLLVSAVRLVAATVALGLDFFGEFWGAGFLSPWEVGLPVLAYAVLSPVSQRRAGKVFPSLTGAVADSVVALTAVALNGGWQSPYFLFLFPAVVAVALRLPFRQGLLLNSGLALLYGLVAVLAVWYSPGDVTPAIITDNLAILLVTALVTGTLNWLWRNAEEHRRQEAHLTRQLTILNRLLSETMPVSLDQASTMRTVAELTREAFESDVAGVLVRQNTDWRLWVAGVAKDGEVLTLPPGTAHLLTAFTPLEVSDVTQSEFAAPLGTELAIKSLILTPVQALDRPLGLLFVGQRTPRSFQEEERRLLLAIARQAGFAIRNVQLYRVEREQIQQLQELERLKTDFFNNISHDLLTPIGTITTAAGLLLSDTESRLSPLAGSLLQNIARNAERLTIMVNDLLELARLQSGRVHLKRSVVAPTALAAAVVSSMAPLLAPKQQRLEFHAPPDLPPVWADRGQLERILTNLIENAHKYTPQGGTITLALDQQEQFIRFTVCDTGPGIPRELQGQVFERFYRPEGSESRSGSGLGLSIVKTLAELHGGWVKVESTPGRGTAFTVAIPMWDQGASHEDPDR